MKQLHENESPTSNNKRIKLEMEQKNEIFKHDQDDKFQQQLEPDCNVQKMEQDIHSDVENDDDRLTLQNLKRDIDETIQKHDQNYEEIVENRVLFLKMKQDFENILQDVKSVDNISQQAKFNSLSVILEKINSSLQYINECIIQYLELRVSFQKLKEEIIEKLLDYHNEFI